MLSTTTKPFNFTPFHDRVLVKRISLETHQGAIVIPDSLTKPPLTGRVVAIGQGRVIHGVLYPVSARLGDLVFFADYSGADLTLPGHEEPFKILRDEEILGRAEVSTSMLAADEVMALSITPGYRDQLEVELNTPEVEIG